MDKIKRFVETLDRAKTKIIDIQKFKLDEAFGKQNENDIMQKLKDTFNDNTLRMTERYARVDFIGERVIVELKSRKNTKGRYPSTIINKSKIDYLIKNKPKKDIYFVFRFTDCDCYIKYEESRFKDFKLTTIIRRDRGFEEGEYIEIKLRDLTEF